MHYLAINEPYKIARQTKWEIFLGYNAVSSGLKNMASQGRRHDSTIMGVI